MRILICDDDTLILEHIYKLLKYYFESAHLKMPEIISYSNGESLLMDKGSKDIVFLDIEMPGMNGIYVGNELKSQNRNVIIFLLLPHILSIWMKPCVFMYSVIFQSHWISNDFSEI